MKISKRMLTIYLVSQVCCCNVLRGVFFTKCQESQR